MSIVVQHDKRRKGILEKALTVFIDEGFENATFQRIADRCGITRTTLYLYFKNKKEIFKYSIKQMLTEIEEKLNVICSDKSIGSVEKITKVLLEIFKLLEHNRLLLAVILDYLLHDKKSESYADKRIRRRTVKLRHILSSLVIEGISQGQLKKVKIKTASNYLYSFITAAIFHLVILKQKSIEELKEMTIFAVKRMAV